MTTKKDALSQESKAKLIEWLLNGNTGISSKSMAAVAVGTKLGDGWGFDAPHDPSDFSRCYKLVQRVPEIRRFFPQIGRRIPKFKGILDNWDNLCRIHDRDIDSGGSSELYILIKTLRGDKNRKGAINEVRNLSDLINLKNAGYDVGSDILSFVANTSSNTGHAEVNHGEFNVNSFQNYFRCGVKSGFRKEKCIPLFLDKDLEFKIDVAELSKTKSKYSEPVAAEVIKFIENGYYDDSSEESIEGVKKVRSYILKKFPKIQELLASDDFPRDRPFSDLPKSLKPARKMKRAA